VLDYLFVLVSSLECLQYRVLMSWWKRLRD